MERAAPPPKPSFTTGTRLFICVLAVTHAVAFGSIWVQADGLIGPSGVLPAGTFFSMVHERVGARGWYYVPSLLWVFGAGSIKAICAIGLILSAVLLAGYMPALCLGLLWACYLSLVSAGQTFLEFQWDVLLLESTLIAVFLVPWRLRRITEPYDPPRLARYLVWWLLFRLMFLSGYLKLSSGDPTWRHLTALTFHYQTQPLPTPIAWYANQLPMWFQVTSCAVMFAIELLAPLCLAAPRRIRHWAALSLIALQVIIALTGNYAFFNLLSIGLCLTCLDDEWWRKRHWGVGYVSAEQALPAGKRFKATALRWFAAFSVGVTFFETVASMSPGAAGSPLVRWVAEGVGPFCSFNDYGLFRVMTVERPELVIEGSDDGRDWREYALPYMPGDLARRPAWVAPYQPRLDWQLWFAALGPADGSPWVGTLCEKLLRGDAAVLGLFSHNPFPTHPPRQIRVVRYKYEFTGAGERARTGNWWRRTPIDFYIPPVSLTTDTQ